MIVDFVTVDCRLRVPIADRESPIVNRQSQATIVDLNRQSSIDQIRNHQSAIRSPQSA
jgi:hypothetical protein